MQTVLQPSSEGKANLRTLRCSLRDHYVLTANPHQHYCSYWGRHATAEKLGCHWASINRERTHLVLMGLIRIVPPEEARTYGITARCTVVQLLPPAIRLRQDADAKDALPEAAASVASSSVELKTAAFERAAVPLLPAAKAKRGDPEIEKAVKLLVGARSANGRVVCEDDARDILRGRRNLIGHIRRIIPHYAKQVIHEVTGGGWWRAALRRPDMYGRDEAGVAVEQARVARAAEAKPYEAKRVTGQETDTERRGKKMLVSMNDQERDHWINFVLEDYCAQLRPDVFEFIADPDVPWDINRNLHFAVGKVAYPVWVRERHRERGLHIA